MSIWFKILILQIRPNYMLKTTKYLLSDRDPHCKYHFHVLSLREREREKERERERETETEKCSFEINLQLHGT
jgi:hypothetical protein